jgi:hypothetical protein
MEPFRLRVKSPISELKCRAAQCMPYAIPLPQQMAQLVDESGSQQGNFLNFALNQWKFKEAFQ